MITAYYDIEESRLITAQTLDKFLSLNERRAYRMALIATGNREDALDITQDAMFKLVQKYSKRTDDEWGPLFHRIVQSTIRDWYRRSKVRNGLRFFFSQEDSASDPMDSLQNLSDPGPGAELKQQRAIQELDKALHKLPLRQQQAFLLRQWEGLNTQQTATAMGCSQGSVKTHLSRAIGTLRNQLETHWL